MKRTLLTCSGLVCACATSTGPDHLITYADLARECELCRPQLDSLLTIAARKEQLRESDRFRSVIGKYLGG